MERGRRRLIAVLCVGTLAAFAPLLASPLVYDDGHSVEQNEAIRTLANVPAFFVDATLFSSTGNPMYRPVVLCTLALDHALGGGATWVFKCANVLMHLAASLLLLRFLERLALPPAACFAGAVLFALHPIQTEAVALVSARSEILLAIGVLVALHGWLTLRAGGRAGWLALLAGSLVALGSKESAVVLPVVLAGAEFALRQGTVAQAVRRILVPTMAVAAWLVVRKLVLGTALTSVPRLSGGGEVLTGSRDFATQLLVQAALVPKALLLLVWPPALCLDHGIPPGGGSAADPGLWVGLVLLLAPVVACLAAPRRRPLLFVGALLAGCFAAPWILVPLNVPFAEHRLYLPMAGVALCVAWCTPRLAEALRGAGALSRATCVAAALLVTLSFARSLTFTHEKSLWEDVTAKSPSSFRGHTGVAHVLWKAGDLAGARASFDRALAIHPRYGHAFDGLARLLIEEGRRAGDLVLLDRAVAMNQELVALRPTDPFARMGASAAFLARGTVGRNAADFAESERLALSCLDVAEPKSLIFRAAAEAREAAGDVDGALALLDESDRRGLAREPTALARARTLAAAARFGEAEAVLREVLQASPFAPEAHAQLAWLCRRDGRDAEAVVHELLGPGGAPPQLRGTPAAAPGAGPNR